MRTSFGEYLFIGGAQFNGGDVTGVHGEDDLWLTKFAANGDLVWQKALGGTGSDFGMHVIEATDGGFVCAGRSDSNDGDVTGNHGEADAWVVKTNGAGVIEWEKSLGGSGTELAWDILQTSDGGFVMVGEAASTDGDVSGNLGANDLWVVRLNSTGELLWEQSYGGSSSDWATTVSQCPNGNLLVAGTTSSSDLDVTGFHGGGTDIWAIMLNASGELLWQRALGGSGFDVGACSLVDDAGIYVAGRTASDDGDVTSSFGSDDAWLVSLSEQGDILWQSSFGGTGNESARGVDRNPDGGLFLAGSTNSTNGQVSSNHGGFDAWVLKVDAQGALVWEKSLGGSNDDSAADLLDLPDGGYLVTAYSSSVDGDLSGNNGNIDFWAVKLTSEPIGISEDPDRTSAYLFPNPTQDEVWIQSPSGECIQQADFLDAAGRLCRSFASPMRTALDVSALEPGNYFCRMRTANGLVRALSFIKE